MSYATLQQYRAAHVLDATALAGAYSDNEVQAFLDQATAWLDSQLYQSITTTVITSEPYSLGTPWLSVNNHGALHILPKRFPIQSVQAIAWRTDPSDNFTRSFATTDYSLDTQMRRIIVPFNCPFRRHQWGEVSLSYTYGYATIPADIVLACILVGAAIGSVGYAAVDLRGAGVRAILPEWLWTSGVAEVVSKYMRRF